jgi:ADP-ribose pyrophosphatase
MYECISANMVYKSAWMEVYEDLLKDEHSKVETFNRIKVKDVVTIVPLLEDDLLLMVENYRHGAGMVFLELPGGFIEEDEEPSHTARRELLEETSYTAESLEFRNWFYTWPGRSTQRNYVFLARGLRMSSEQQYQKDFGYVNIRKMSREHVMRELKEGIIRSAVTISALFYGYFY